MPVQPPVTPPPADGAPSNQRPPALPPHEYRWADRRDRAAGAARAFLAVKAQQASRRTTVEALADRLTRLASSTAFLLAHVLAIAAWIVINTVGVGLPRFDPFPFGLLTLALSIEAIVLTIFVLMSQGREAAVAELREEITLQVNLRIEEEVTKSLQLLTGLYARLGLELGDEPELRDMLRPLDAHGIEHDLVAQMQHARRDAQRDAEE